MSGHGRTRDRSRDPTIHSDHRAGRRRLVALCPELDIASQGDSIEAARSNLQEALELFFETASPEEIKQRLA